MILINYLKFTENGCLFPKYLPSFSFRLVAKKETTKKWFLEIYALEKNYNGKGNNT